jgi:hypothetical protein
MIMRTKTSLGSGVIGDGGGSGGLTGGRVFGSLRGLVRGRRRGRTGANAGFGMPVNDEHRCVIQ